MSWKSAESGGEEKMRAKWLWPGLAALALAGAVPSALAENAPLRLGLLTVKTGPLAAGGIQMEQGLNLCLKERGGAMAGRKVELVVGDTGGNPAGAKTKSQELVERDKVDVVLGPLAAFEVYAIDEYIRQAQVPTLPVAAAEDITQRKANPWIVRVLGTSAQDSHAMADYAAKALRFKRIATIADDFAYGHETIAGFQRVFEDNGGKIVKKLWPPLNTADYTPYLAQIAETRHLDAVYMGFAGSNPVRFIKQFAEYGLKQKVALLGNGTAADAPILRFLGEEAAGILAAETYSTTFESPLNRRFLEGFRRDYHVDPGLYSLATYLGCQLLDSALQQTNGLAGDRAALVKAMRAVALADSPRGPLRIDDYGNAVGNSFIRKIELVNGRLVDRVVKVYPSVSQFWTYDPAWFLAQPVYSRDYPPARYLEP
jgi:branched-chain amino acid transport system substrate-binding protein